MSNPLFQFLGDNNLVEVAVVILIIILCSSVKLYYRSAPIVKSTESLLKKFDKQDERIDRLSEKIDKNIEELNLSMGKQPEEIDNP